MQQDQYDYLKAKAAAGEVVSIAVNKDGKPSRGVFIPWEHTASAFNMKTPRVTLAADDLQDDTVMGLLRACYVIGCYIFTPLTDYSFLAEFDRISDLFILKGENMRDLSFLQNYKKLFMFYLEDATLPGLQPLVDTCTASRMMPGKCLGFYHCTIEDTAALLSADFYISELLVWPVKGDAPARWQCAEEPGTFRFFTEKEDT